MSELHFKDKDRIFLSILLAVVLHAALFFLIQFLVKAVPEIPEYSGPLFVEITDNSNTHVMDARELAEEPEADEREASAPEQPEDVPPEELQETTLVENARLVQREQESAPEEAPPPEPEPQENKVPVAAAPEPVTERPTETRATPARTPVPSLTPRSTPVITPEEESAFGEDLMANLDNVLEHTAPPEATKGPVTSLKPGAGGGQESSSGTTSGGTTPQIFFDRIEEERSVKKRGTPDLSPFANLDFTKGEVILSFTILPQGFLDNEIGVVKSSGYTEVDNAVIAALKKYEFNPINGTESVKAKISFEILNK